MKLSLIESSGGEPRFALSFRYSPSVVAIVKAIPGMAWDPEGRVWTGYSDAIEALLNRLEREGVRASPTPEALEAFQQATRHDRDDKALDKFLKSC